MLGWNGWTVDYSAAFLLVAIFQAMMKNKLVEPTLAVVFPLMASVPNPEELDEDDDDEDDAPDGAEASRPCAVASQVRSAAPAQHLVVMRV